MTDPHALPMASAPHAEAVPYRPEADSFDFRRAGRIVRLAMAGHRRLIVAVTALTLALVTLYILVWPPVYSASVTLSAVPDDDRQRESFYDSWAVFRRNALKDERVLLTSGPVLKQVISDLDLRYEDVYHPPLRYLTYLWTQSWPGQAWRATKDFLRPRQPSRYVPTQEEVDRARTLDDFRTGVAMIPVADSNIGLLTVRGPSPRVAEIADKVAATYIAQRRRRFADEAHQAYAALQAETERAHRDLRALEQRMERYYTQNDMLLMFEKDKIEVGQLLQQQQGVDDKRVAIAETQRELSVVAGQLAREGSTIVASRLVQDNPVAAALRQERAKLVAARDSMLLRYRPDSPDVRDMNDQIAAIEKQLAAEPQQGVQQTNIARNSGHDALRARKAALEAKLAADKAGLVALSAEVEARRQQIDRIPQKMKDSHDLSRAHDILEKTYLALQDKLMTAAVTAATAQSAPSAIQVVEGASLPDKPDAPRTKLLLVAAIVVGIGSGIASAVVLDLLQNRANRFRLTQPDSPFPLLAIVEQDRAHARRLFEQ
ncbi:GumC family protein [Sphingobium cloacae]|uniref:Chain length determinant protein n=1 Tax=Sphingobium cloacae TaxID=120107 RepID=A0A1E1F376_9SPHN|nr:Wzz/FepE/Etk N-terminal domain-containing protein [Sphingobium cloacae]BAV64964.1 chain length determinant protein [Sphingobium cloacae]